MICEGARWTAKATDPLRVIATSGPVRSDRAGPPSEERVRADGSKKFLEMTEKIGAVLSWSEVS